MPKVWFTSGTHYAHQRTPRLHLGALEPRASAFRHGRVCPSMLGDGRRGAMAARRQ